MILAALGQNDAVACYRVISPAYAGTPLSGMGAARQGGRPLWADFAVDWRSEWFDKSVEPPTWHMADDAVEAECDGILFPSQARHGGTHLVVFRSSGRPASQLHVYDPADVLKRIAMPRQMD